MPTPTLTRLAAPGTREGIPRADMAGTCAQHNARVRVNARPTAPLHTTSDAARHIRNCTTQPQSKSSFPSLETRLPLRRCAAPHPDPTSLPLASASYIQARPGTPPPIRGPRPAPSPVNTAAQHGPPLVALELGAPSCPSATTSPDTTAIRLRRSNSVCAVQKRPRIGSRSIRDSLHPRGSPDNSAVDTHKLQPCTYYTSV